VNNEAEAESEEEPVTSDSDDDYEPDDLNGVEDWEFVP
jgi:hypothetical protein